MMLRSPKKAPLKKPLLMGEVSDLGADGEGIPVYFALSVKIKALDSSPIGGAYPRLPLGKADPCGSALEPYLTKEVDMVVV